jgi:NAD(P)-dependent dehydrogenase (short-subunit alcohol dehydrogenase family)
VIETNLSGAFYACKHALPHMLRQGGGTIVNTSSVAAIRYTGYPYASYYASKAALNHFTTSVALQYARQGIRANAVMPGLMNTPLIYRQISGQYPSLAAMIDARNQMTPTGRMGTAWDIAHAVLFLASDESRYINGVSLPVDGGLHCGH